MDKTLSEFPERGRETVGEGEGGEGETSDSGGDCFCDWFGDLALSALFSSAPKHERLNAPSAASRRGGRLRISITCIFLALHFFLLENMFHMRLWGCRFFHALCDSEQCIGRIPHFPFFLFIVFLSLYIYIHTYTVCHIGYEYAALL